MIQPYRTLARPSLALPGPHRRRDPDHPDERCGNRSDPIHHIVIPRAASDRQSSATSMPGPSYPVGAGAHGMCAIRDPHQPYARGPDTTLGHRGELMRTVGRTTPQTRSNDHDAIRRNYATLVRGSRLRTEDGRQQPNDRRTGPADSEEVEPACRSRASRRGNQRPLIRGSVAAVANVDRCYRVHNSA